MTNFRTKKSSVSVIILNWNGLSDTLECLESVFNLDKSQIQIILVDNGSTDGSIEVIRTRFPQVTVLENSENLGYAEGNNVGLRYAIAQEADYVLVLNNDTVVEKDILNVLVKDLEEHPQAAAAAPKSYYYDKPEVVYFSGGKISSTGFVRHINQNEIDSPELNQATDTEWLNGCSILFRVEFLKKVGIFDRRFFLLFEDTDWSMRARRAGYTLRIVPDARIWHKSSSSFGESWSPVYLYYYTRNRLLWIRKNFPIRQQARIFFLDIKKNTKPIHTFWKFLTDKSPKSKAIRYAYRDFLSYRFGKRSYDWK